MKLMTLIGGGLLLALAPAAHADMATYYVGLDTGTGPNNGHLTLLRAHGDHFHRLGTFGGAEGRIPEAYIGGHLELRPGAGPFAGRLVSGAYETPGSEVGGYSDLEIRPIATLVGFGPGTPEATLIGGGQRYLGPLGGTLLALELVDISPGLDVADESGDPILVGVGDRHVLGAGDAFDAFLPRFSTAAGAPAGTPYSAAFRLVDLNGIAPASGTFRYEFAAATAVPEPASLALLGAGLCGAVAVTLRSRRRAARGEGQARSTSSA